MKKGYLNYEMENKNLLHLIPELDRKKNRKAMEKMFSK